ncbi:hypothetical protein M0802_000004 [Mischocyttarus mexicanus]|nr:hypothetical protein M0802_000004 [Mischocyttarus mexicanus]
MISTNDCNYGDNGNNDDLGKDSSHSLKCRPMSKRILDIMKSLVFFVFFLLCAYTQADISNHKIAQVAEEVGLSVNEMQSCLNKGQVDLETFLELSETIFDVEVGRYPSNVRKQVGAVTACIFKKHGVLRESKLYPNELIQLINNRLGEAKRPIPPQVITIIHKCCKDGK